MSAQSIILHRMYRYEIDVSISVCAYGFSGGWNLGDGKLLCPQYWHLLLQHFSINIVCLIFLVKLFLRSLSYFARMKSDTLRVSLSHGKSHHVCIPTPTSTQTCFTLLSELSLSLSRKLASNLKIRSFAYSSSMFVILL